jgi:hypothetical protein
MNTNEQKAFVEAYDNTICNMPTEKLIEFVRLYESGEDVSHFATYEYTSIVDALGIWHSAIYWNLTKSRDDNDIIECPHCHEKTHIGSLIGKNTNDCPKCGKQALFNEVTA